MKKHRNPLHLLLNALLSAYFLTLGSFVFACAIPEESLLSLIQTPLVTTRDFCLFFLWLMLLAGASVFLGGVLRQKTAIVRMSPMESRWVRWPLAVLLLCFLGSFSLMLYTESRVVINEVCGKNESVIYDEDLKAGDYVELYNPSVFSVDLRELYLSDDLGRQPKSLAGNTIPGKGYCLVWTNKGENPFGIRAEGDTVYLTNGQKRVLDAVTTPALQEGQVYARDAGTLQWHLCFPSPLEENDPNIHPIDAPVFSAESGFYDGEFALTLQAQEGCQIYYTLDSSTPDENALLYTGPIPVKNPSSQPDVYRAVQNITLDWANSDPVDPEGTVDKAAIVRAVAIDAFGNRSSVVTKSYFVDLPQYRNQYVLSLVSDPEDLFGQNGIYVTGKEYDDWYTGTQQGTAPVPNFEKRGKAYEVETSAELFHNRLLMEQQAGLRVQGGTSRSSRIKRLMLFSRKIYSGDSCFSYDFWETPSHSVHLRSDFEDAFCHSLLAGSEIGGLRAMPVVVFLDGEYWYSTYLRERYSDDDLALRFQLPESSSIVTSDVLPEELLEFVQEQDLQGNDDAYEQLNRMMDIENYAKFLSANIYLCNMDMSDIKNIRLWKTNGNGTDFDDGRWRFLLYDVDALLWRNERAYGIGSYGVNSFTASMRFEDYSHSDSPLFSALKRNDQFRETFCLVFMDLANTCFEKEYVAACLEQWGQSRDWNDGFFDKRFDYIVPAMAQEMNLQGTLETISLSCGDPLAGKLRINTVTPELENGSWQGSYYTDFPVTISAEASEGYEFVAWHCDGKTYPEKTISVSLTSGENQWTAEFKRTGEGT